jgi:hypothetical protein
LISEEEQAVYLVSQEPQRRWRLQTDLGLDLTQRNWTSRFEQQAVSGVAGGGVHEISLVVDMFIICPLNSE